MYLQVSMNMAEVYRCKKDAWHGQAFDFTDHILTEPPISKWIGPARCPAKPVAQYFFMSKAPVNWDGPGGGPGRRNLLSHLSKRPVITGNVYASHQ
jgi:hypothetical protein